jgi:hypothetical protein
MKRLNLLVMLLCLQSNAVAAESVNYPLGDSIVSIEVISRKQSFVFFLPHDNEKTAQLVAQEVLANSAGRVVMLTHKGGREISFAVEGTKYIFDPNRIFTPKGLLKTLHRKDGGTVSGEAQKQVEGFASSVLQKIRLNKSSRRLIALHNNTNGAYAITSYLPGGKFAQDAEAVFINPDQDSDDFFFVTVLGDFQALKELNFNVVLQSSSVTDDGSLSVWAAKNNVPYINVEAESGHKVQQVLMLQTLLGLFN